MSNEAKLKVKILEHTPNPEKLIAESAKLCYSSSNIEELEENLTEENVEKFIKMLMSLGHESPLEHVSFTFAVEGISRSVSHQLVRHRIASYSQQSQRYVKLDQFEYIIPSDIAENEYIKEIFIKHMENCQKAYDELVERLMLSKMHKYHIDNGLPLINTMDIRVWKEHTPKNIIAKIEKESIENARAVLPNACETKIIFTMNLRTLLHFFNERVCLRAQSEIRQMAIEMLKQCKKVSPILFSKVGAKCVNGYCPEGKMSCGIKPTLDAIIKSYNDSKKVGE